MRESLETVYHLAVFLLKATQKFGRFIFVVVQGAASKCKKTRDARAEVLFCSLKNYCVLDFPVFVAVLVS